MNPFYEELTKEQRCAVIGFAVDFCGCKVPTQLQLSELEDILMDLRAEMGVSREEVEMFVNKMQVKGRLAYAIMVMKTIKDEPMYGLFYRHFYRIVATLKSREGLAKLNRIYKNEFGYDDEEINELWKLYDLKDFRDNTAGMSSTYSSGRGCMALILAITTSIVACLCGIILMM